jgi:ribosome-associated translation inhibitor RaiA
MTTTATAPAREVVRAAIAAGHHRVADLITATGLPRQTVSNALTDAKARGIVTHDAQRNEWHLAPPVSSAAPSVTSTPPVDPQWLARWAALFEQWAAAVTPLLTITPALQQAADAVDLAAERRAEIVDAIAQLASERTAVQAQIDALTVGQASDGTLDALDDQLNRVTTRLQRRAVALHTALRQFGQAQVSYLALVTRALVSAADTVKGRLAPTDAEWKRLHPAFQLGPLDTTAIAALAAERRPDTAGLDLLDRCYQLLPTQMAAAQRLAALDERSAQRFLEAAERMDADRARLADLRARVAQLAALRPDAVAQLDQLQAHRDTAIAAHTDAAAQFRTTFAEFDSLCRQSEQLAAAITDVRGQEDES